MTAAPGDAAAPTIGPPVRRSARGVRSDTTRVDGPGHRFVALTPRRRAMQEHRPESP